MVAVVVVRGVGGTGLADEVRDLGEELGAEVRVFGLVGDDVDEVLRRDFGRQGELVEIKPGDDRGVLELLNRRGRVESGHRAGRGLVSLLENAADRLGGSWRTLRCERSADAPAGWNGDRGLDGDVLDRDVGRVEH